MATEQLYAKAKRGREGWHERYERTQLVLDRDATGYERFADQQGVERVKPKKKPR